MGSRDGSRCGHDGWVGRGMDVDLVGRGGRFRAPLLVPLLQTSRFRPPLLSTNFFVAGSLSRFEIAPLSSLQEKVVQMRRRRSQAFSLVNLDP